MISKTRTTILKEESGLDYRKEVREMRLMNKRMYDLTGEAGAALGALYE